MAEEDYSFYVCLKLLLLAVSLMLYELIFFAAFLSLSIGIGVGVKIVVKMALDLELHVVLETFCSWYTLAVSTELHLKLYRKFVYARLRNKIRRHGAILQGFPRLVYFVLYCLAVCGIYYEYQAVHSYRPTAGYLENNSPLRTHRLFRSHIRKRSELRIITNAQEFSAEAPNEKRHTALFLVMMSYIIYSSGQVLCLFMIRLLQTIPLTPFLPQIYGSVTMMILQAVVTAFYAFPIAMTLIACYVFRVDGLSTYMFAVSVALSVALAAAQLESDSPFPTEARVGPVFYFEGQFRARINLIFILLPTIAYYYFKRNRSYPLTALDQNFGQFTFWLITTLLHTIKSLYLTTWRPVNMGEGAQEVVQREQPGDVGGRLQQRRVFRNNRDVEGPRVVAVELGHLHRIEGEEEPDLRNLWEKRLMRARGSNTNPPDDEARHRARVNYSIDAETEIKRMGGACSSRKRHFVENCAKITEEEDVNSAEGNAASAKVNLEPVNVQKEINSCFASTSRAVTIPTTLHDATQTDDGGPGDESKVTGRSNTKSVAVFSSKRGSELSISGGGGREDAEGNVLKGSVVIARSSEVVDERDGNG